MSRLSVDLKRIWTFALVLYIICSTAFSYGDLRMLNTYALYFFLGVSAFCILLKMKLRLDVTIISLVVYTTVMLFGVLYTPASNSAAMNVLYNYCTMAVVVVCVIQYIDSVEDVEKIITSFMWAGAVLAIYVYAQYGNEFWELMQGATDYESGHIDRLGEELTNTNTIGMVTAISTVIALYKLIYQKPRLLGKMLYIAIAVFCFLINMASASKKGLLLLVVAALGIWIYATIGNKHFVRQTRNLIVLCLLGVGLFWLINNVKLFSALSVRLDGFFDLVEGSTADGSSEARAYMIEKGLEVWLEHPLFGAGTYSSQYYFGVYSHNNYVELLMNSGLIGFLVFYVPQTIGLFRFFVHYKSYKENSKLAGMLFALLVGIVVCSIGMVYYYDRYFMILLAVIIAATSYLKKQPDTQMDSRSEAV